MSNKHRGPKPVPVTHKMFGADGVLPCCGLSRYEVVQTDRVAMEAHHEITCTGKKRYEPVRKP